jgi:hypothetical protein
MLGSLSRALSLIDALITQRVATLFRVATVTAGRCRYLALVNLHFGKDPAAASASSESDQSSDEACAPVLPPPGAAVVPPAEPAAPPAGPAPVPAPSGAGAGYGSGVVEGVGSGGALAAPAPRRSVGGASDSGVASVAGGPTFQRRPEPATVGTCLVGNRGRLCILPSKHQSMFPTCAPVVGAGVGGGMCCRALLWQLLLPWSTLCPTCLA